MLKTSLCVYVLGLMCLGNEGILKSLFMNLCVFMCVCEHCVLCSSSEYGTAYP